MLNIVPDWRVKKCVETNGWNLGETKMGTICIFALTSRIHDLCISICMIIFARWTTVTQEGGMFLERFQGLFRDIFSGMNNFLSGMKKTRQRIDS